MIRTIKIKGKQMLSLYHRLARNRTLSRLRRLKNRNVTEYLESEISQMQIWLEELEKQNVCNSYKSIECLSLKHNTVLNSEERLEELFFQYSLLNDQLEDIKLYSMESAVLKWLVYIVSISCSSNYRMTVMKIN